MNKIESLIHSIVKKNPKLKTIIRDIYQSIMWHIPTKKQNIKYEISIREGFFYGFHDKSPFSSDNKYLLANKINSPFRKPNSTDTLEIGIFHGEKHKEYKPIAKTRAFNWQQGCMLQWIGNSSNLIFNDIESNCNISRIFDSNGQHVKDLDYPISAVDPTGNYALSYSFARLQKYAPGYGYSSIIDEEADKYKPCNQGISIIDITQGTSTLLYSVEQIAAFKHDDSMSKAHHYITHCLFSPSGKRFYFLHRWIKDMNVTKTRMFTCDLDGGNLHLFQTTGMVSHIGWKDETHLLAFCSVKEGDRYVLFEDQSGSYEIIGEKSFNSDGHPSFSPANKDWILTDTYPNGLRYCYLYLYHIPSCRKYALAELRIPLKYKEELRCDFHPRWDRNGEIVCFDSAHTGTRSLCTIELKEFFKNT